VHLKAGGDKRKVEEKTAYSSVDSCALVRVLLPPSIRVDEPRIPAANAVGVTAVKAGDGGRFLSTFLHLHGLWQGILKRPESSALAEKTF
jgi:hypothetical protein